MKSNEILPNEIRDRLYSSWYSSDEKDELIPKILEALQIAESEIEERDIIKTSMANKIDELRKEVRKHEEFHFQMKAKISLDELTIESKDKEIEEKDKQYKVLLEICDNRKREIARLENSVLELKDIVRTEKGGCFNEIVEINKSLITDNEILKQQLKDCQEAAIEKGNQLRNLAEIIDNRGRQIKRLEKELKNNQ